MADSLSISFIYELFRLCFLKRSILDRLKEHLKYQHLPTSELKQIYKTIINHYSVTNTLPTFGIVYEQNKSDEKVISVLNQIKDSDICDAEPLLRQLENYIKDVRFVELWQNVIEMNKKDSERARKLMAEGSTEIVEFSIFKGSSLFLNVFKDFKKIQLDKQIRKEEGLDKYDKLPFGILPCDLISNGGMDRKDTVIWIMRSGVGKSTVLKWHGMYACRLGADVLHIQAEGSEEEAFDKYTQIWSALSYNVVKNGNMSDEDYEKLLKIVNDMLVMQQDISIKSFEQFDEITMVDVRDTVVEYIKEHGKSPELLILDSLDLCNPGDGIKYGADTQSIKMKLQNCSRKFKNICNEFDMRGITADQASDVKSDIWNDPDRVITRSDSMGDKNIANAFSFVFTGNQTLDEEKNDTMRIYFDKVRYYGSGTRTYPIATNFKIGRFFDAQRTRKLFKDIYVE